MGHSWSSKILIQLLSQVAKQHLNFDAGNDLKPFNGYIQKKMPPWQVGGLHRDLAKSTKSPKIDFTKVATVDAVVQGFIVLEHSKNTTTEE